MMLILPKSIDGYWFNFAIQLSDLCFGSIPFSILEIRFALYLASLLSSIVLASLANKLLGLFYFQTTILIFWTRFIQRTHWEFKTVLHMISIFLQ